MRPPRNYILGDEFRLAGSTGSMDITPELLRRFNAGECSPAEKQAVEHWLDNPDAPDSAMDAIPDAIRQEAGARVWDRLQKREERPFRLQYRHYLSGIAAALMLVGGITWYSARMRAEKNTLPVAAVQSVRTQKGETKRFTLPDGTVAELSYDSEIRFPLKFTDSIRRVFLYGEAHFTVRKNPVQPFILETPMSQARVLGTVFNVKEYPGDGSATLLVTEGRVRFSNKTSAGSAILTAGQSGIIEDGKLTKRTTTGTDAGIAWLNNSLYFANIPLTQVARELERKYNVRIDIGTDALKKQRYTGTFRNPSLNAVLSSLGYAIGFRYEIKGEYISLYE